MNWFTKKWDMDLIHKTLGKNIVDDGLRNRDPYAIFWVDMNGQGHVFSATRETVAEFAGELLKKPKDIKAWAVVNKKCQDMKFSLFIHVEGL